MRNRFSLFKFSGCEFEEIDQIAERLNKYSYVNLAKTDRLNPQVSFCGIDEIVDELNFDKTPNRIVFNMVSQSRVINKNLVNKELELVIEGQYPELIDKRTSEEYQFVRDEVTNDLAGRFITKTSFTQIGLSLKSKLLYLFCSESEAMSLVKRIASILELRDVRLLTLSDKIDYEGSTIEEAFQVVLASSLLKSITRDNLEVEKVVIDHNSATFELNSKEINQIPSLIINAESTRVESITFKIKEGSTDGHWLVKLDASKPGKFWLDSHFPGRELNNHMIDFIEYDEGVDRLIGELRNNYDKEKNVSTLISEIFLEISKLEFE